MIIEFRNTTTGGNNLRTEMFFDGFRVAEIHCTPKQFDHFKTALAYEDRSGVTRTVPEA